MTPERNAAEAVSMDFRAVVDASPNAYLVLDRSLNIAWANQAFLEDSGRTLADIVGRGLGDVVPHDPQALRQSVESVERVIRTGARDEMTPMRVDRPRPPGAGGGSEPRGWRMTHSPIVDANGEVTHVLRCPTDMTALERLRDEVAPSVTPQPPTAATLERAGPSDATRCALEVESERLRALFENAPSFIAVLQGPEHRFEMVNAAYSRLVGGRDVLGKPVREAIGEVVAQGFVDRLDEVYRSGQPFVGGGLPIKLQQPGSSRIETRYVDFVYQPIAGRDGAVSGVFVEGNDVTDAVHNADELRRREQRLQLVVDGALDHAIFTTDDEGRITSWSKGAESIFGWSSEEACGQSLAIIFTPEDRSAGAHRQEIETAALDGHSPDKRWHLRKDGRRVYLNGSLYPLLSAAGLPEGFLKIARDETERRRRDQALEDLTDTLEQRVEERTRELYAAEEQLRQSQKMEAIGQLTGGIAHDFNNLLATITTSLELLQRKVAAGQLDDLERYLGMARNSARSAASMIQRLLAFSRKQSLDFQAIDLNGLVDDTVELLRRSLGEKIDLRLALHSGVCRVRSDRSQLQSALLNLCINSRDAMPGGGVLTLASGAVEIDCPGVGAVPELAPGHYAVLSVADTGTGMSTETLARVFEPFFTTKPVGVGTGLGLSMVYGFARQAGGTVAIESALGAGTVVRLYMPCQPVAASAVDEPAEPQRDEPAAVGFSLLVVEDQQDVRALLMEALQGLGYQAQATADPFVALDRHQALGRIDLLVTDVGLPGMDGRRLAEAIRARQPDVQVLYVTGYAEDDAVRGAFLETGMDILAKPFTLDDLGAKVGRLLQAAPRRR